MYLNEVEVHVNFLKLFCRCIISERNNEAEELSYTRHICKPKEHATSLFVQLDLVLSNLCHVYSFVM